MKEYYTLVASLPHLPYFASAERLPLSRLRLEQRLQMLDEEENRQILIAEQLVGWRLSVGKPISSAHAGDYITHALQQITQPVLRDYVEYRLEMQTVLAALRCRHAQGNLTQVKQAWGFGRWVKQIELHWDAPDFRMGRIHPWVPEAVNLLATGDAVGLQRLLMDSVWHKLSRLADANPFGFEAVTAFVFKWDILQSWLVNDAGAAQQRFRTLIEEVKHVQ